MGDSPYWAAKPKEVLDKYRVRTPLGESVTIDDVVDASAFLLESRAVTGVNLWVDGGWMLTWVSGSIDGVHDWGIGESAQAWLCI